MSRYRKIPVELRSVLCGGLAVWVLLCLGISAQAQLTGTTWNPAGNPTQPSDDLWTTAGNWSGGAVPIAGYKAYFNAGAAPCIVNGTVGGCQISIGDGGPGGVLIVTNGGSLSAGDNTAGNNDIYAWTAIGYNNTGELDIVRTTGFIMRRHVAREDPDCSCERANRHLTGSI